MRVLFVCSGNKSNNKPGVVVQNQANSLIKKGIHIDFFVINKKGLFGYLGAILPLRKKINCNEYNTVHAHYSLSGYVAGIAKALSSKKIKLVVSLMGSDTQGHQKRTKTIRFFSKYFWNETIIKSISMSENLKGTNFTVIPNGVDINCVKPSTELVKRSKYILFPADPKRDSKNYELAEHAVKKMKHKDYRMKILHHRPHSEIIDNLKTCSCVLVTSKWEGSPNIIKEAMACNTPIVSTRVGDVEWLLKDLDGCYLADMYVESVSSAIDKAIYFSQKNNTKGRNRLIKLKLTSDCISDKIVKLYEH